MAKSVFENPKYHQQDQSVLRYLQKELTMREILDFINEIL
jgi:hypothetical protein